MNGNTQRNKKSSLLLILTVIAALVGIIGYLVESKPVNNTDRFFLSNSGGAVVFEHQTHTGYGDDCARCHHDLLFSYESQACGDCHDKDVTPDDFEHGDLKEIEAHTCTTCHQADESKQPGSCRTCHPKVQDQERSLIACNDCHDDEYTPDFLTHDEMQEMDGHSCEGCHISGAIGAVYHEQCNRCHLIENSEKFAAGDGSVHCQRCHLK